MAPDLDKIIDRLKDEAPEARRGAAEALGQLGDVRAVEPLIAILQCGDENDDVRRVAAEALGQIGDPRAVEPLIAVLKDEGVRQDAARVLARIGQPAVPSLIATLQDGEVRRSVVNVLEEIGTPAIEALIAELDDEDKLKRWAAAWALGKVGGHQAVQPLIAALQDEEWLVRQAATNALGELGVPAMQPLIAALQDGDKGIRQAAVWTLAKIGEPAVPPIVTMLRDGDVEVRWAAARALRQIGGSQVVEPLIAALQDRDEDMRRFVAGALGEIRDSRAVEPLLAALQDSDRDVRRSAAKALGRIGDLRAVEPLIALLEHDETWQAAAEGLRYIGGPEVVDPLIAVFEDERRNKHARLAAAETLRRIGDPRAVDPLITALTDRDEEVRIAASKTLGEIGEPAVQPLIISLQDDEGYVRWAATRALREIGDSAVQPLITALRDSDRDVRQAAAWALGKTGDPQALEPLAAALKDEVPLVRETAARSLKQVREAEPVTDDGGEEEDAGESVAQMLARRSVFEAFTVRQHGPTVPHYGDVSFPDRTNVGQVAALRVAVTLSPVSEQAVQLALQLPPDLTEPMRVDVCVDVSPMDFDLQSSNLQTIEVPLDADSAPVIFKLVPREAGRKTIGVEFYQNARYLGRAEVNTTVGVEREPTQAVSSRFPLKLHPRQSAPDLAIHVETTPLVGGRWLCRFFLFSSISELGLGSEEAGQVELQAAPEEYFEAVFAELGEWVREVDTDERVFFKRLSSLGANLYDQLFPEKLKRIYWERVHGRVETLQIVSTDPWIPWEIVRPYHPDTFEEDDFLCEQFALTRWLVGPGSPDEIDFEELALVVAASDLASALDEAEALRQLPGIQIRDVPPSLLDIYDLLETGGFDGLHLACHGEYDRRNPDQSVILLEGGQRLRPNDIAGKKRAFGRDEPLIFFNACETGRAGMSLTGLGGWARAFIGAGAGGFVGSTWEAHDESAYGFAVAFYRRLLEGKTVAEAARLARQAIKRAGDPTWLSYTVYANPLARLVVETARQE